MPEKTRKPESDGDPSTVLEDTHGHERLGFRVNDEADVGGDMDNGGSPLTANLKRFPKKGS